MGGRGYKPDVLAEHISRIDADLKVAFTTMPGTGLTAIQSLTDIGLEVPPVIAITGRRGEGACDTCRNQCRG